MCTDWAAAPRHDRHRLPPDARPRAARDLQVAARVGISLDGGHDVLEQRVHRTDSRAHAPRARRIHGQTHGAAPPAGPRAVRRAGRRAARRSAAHQRRPVGDRARHQYELGSESRRARLAAEAGRHRARVRQGISGERVSLADAARPGHHGRDDAVQRAGLARRGALARAAARSARPRARRLVRAVFQRLSRRSQEAQLAVLWLSAALAAIAFSVATTVRAETDRVSTAADGLRAWYLGAGSVERGIQWMCWGPDFRNPDGSARFWEPNKPRSYLSSPSGEARV